MNNILEDIIERKRHEIKTRKEVIDLDFLQEHDNIKRTGFSLKNALENSTTGIISEFKRKSPSKGYIFKEAKPETVICEYTNAGASAISILTDEEFFGGTLMDLISARSLTDLPILRKDFIVDIFQLYEAKAIGADAILLIAAVLTKAEYVELSRKARELGLEVLLEVHNERELEYIDEYADIVGINNRNLSTFATDVETSIRLGNLIPKSVTKISESGIDNPETVKKLQQAGFKGFLIGEYFMRTQTPGNALSGFINQIS